MFRKKTISIFFLTAFALVLTACAPSGGDQGQPQQTPSTNYTVTLTVQ